MAGGDGRSIFGIVYTGFSLASLWLLDQEMNHRVVANPAGAAVQTLCLLFAVIFGIAGTYKLLTRNKSKSNHEVYDYTKQGDGASHKFMINPRGVTTVVQLKENEMRKNQKNSNIEIQIWKNKPLLAIIILLGISIIGLF
mgnify:FL=1